ncbi:2126_t:CDS:2, partial [Acaulospora colombiana]
IEYSPGKLNIFADALSRIYSNEGVGTVRSQGEYVTGKDRVDEDEGDSPMKLMYVDTSVLPSSPVVFGEGVAAEMALALMNMEIRTRARLKRAAKEDVSYAQTQERKRRAHNSPEPEPTASLKTQRKRGRPKKMVDGHDHELPRGEANQGAKEPPRSRPPKSPESYDPELSPESEEEKPSDYESQASTELNHERQQELISEMEEVAHELEEGHVNARVGEPTPIERVVEAQLTDVINEYDLPNDLQGRYGEDSFFKIVLEKPKHYTNFEVVGEPGKELVYQRAGERRILCIPDIKMGQRRVREIVISHAHSILAHLGSRKTLWYLRENVWWKEMIKDIADYCKTCEVCARTKSSNQTPMGLLHPLPVPKRPWEQVGVDFVGPLPLAKSKYGEFDQVAEVFYETVYKLHGLPERIVSDRDKIFTSTFWQRLHQLMRVQLKKSSTYHPQTDGATERANRTMMQMLVQAIGGRDARWIERLPAIEWAMNAARSETTGFSPFFLNFGYRPRPLIWNNADKDEYPGVHAFAQRMKDAIMQAHDAILEKRVKQTGDLVYLSTKNLKLPKGKSRKLVPKFIGPFSVTGEIVEGTTYKLDLPNYLKERGVHNAFHASLLRIYEPNCDTRFPGRQFEQLAAFGGDEGTWEVERIKSHYRHGKESLFELEWKNGDVTWEPFEQVQDLEALTEYLEAMGVLEVSSLPIGKGQPPHNDPETFVATIAILTGASSRRQWITNQMGGAPSFTSSGLLVALLCSSTNLLTLSNALCSVGPHSHNFVDPILRFSTAIVMRTALMPSA